MNIKYKKSNCLHKRKKKNYPFGRGSKPTISCKDCGKVLSKHEMMKDKQEEKRNRGRRYG